MSVAGIASSGLSLINSLHNSNQGQVQAKFQQLAQDLQSGNLSGAQTDFATLTQTLSPSKVDSSGPAAQAFSALGQALQSGNLAGAQRDFATLKQDVRQNQSHSVHHHHHHNAEAPQNSEAPFTQGSNSVAQAFNALGQSLQSGNLSNAQQAFALVQQDLQMFASSASSDASNVSSSITSASLNLEA
jgi:hypothetical protein